LAAAVSAVPAAGAVPVPALASEPGLTNACDLVFRDHLVVRQGVFFSFPLEGNRR
jgi:hypothetical protein